MIRGGCYEQFFNGVFSIGQFRFASKVQTYSNLATNSPLLTSTSRTWRNLTIDIIAQAWVDSAAVSISSQSHAVLFSHLGWVAKAGYLGRVHCARRSFRS